MRITLNGEPKEVLEEITVAELLTQLGLDPKFLAVERNQQLIPRGRHRECRLADGDNVEIVTLVGGG